MAIVNYDLLEGSVITTRIRLARNLTNYPFHITDQTASKDVVKKVNRALVKCDTFNLYFASNLSDLTLEEMKEKHLISNAFIENKPFSAALINPGDVIVLAAGDHPHLFLVGGDGGLDIQALGLFGDLHDDPLAQQLGLRQLLGLDGMQSVHPCMGIARRHAQGNA